MKDKPAFNDFMGKVMVVLGLIVLLASVYLAILIADNLSIVHGNIYNVAVTGYIVVFNILGGISLISGLVILYNCHVKKVHVK
ncbi:hypothetical protein HXZ66_01760 [Bacillus sp. A116_S68]|nr:hypothetical protein HXZ66_01760 [Bacillus sp. A116_S68]